jgi:DNA-binding transcriptional MerR regulator
MIRIGELARQTGLAPSKIRFYEAEGLIGAVDRKLNGYRQYSDRTKQVLELISLAQQAGFSLAEIRALVPQQGKVSGSHDRMLAGLRKKLAELEALQNKRKRDFRCTLTAAAPLNRPRIGSNIRFY